MNMPPHTERREKMKNIEKYFDELIVGTDPAMCKIHKDITGNDHCTWNCRDCEIKSLE